MRKPLVLLALVASGSLAGAGNAWADNSASGSTGTVQVGNTSVDASAGGSTAAGDANVSAPASIAGTGDNAASNSTGAVQVGGGNTADRSTGVVQTNSVSSSPSAGAGSGTTSVFAGAPVAVGGGGGNTASGSTGAVQVGGGNSLAGSASAPATAPAGTAAVPTRRSTVQQAPAPGARRTLGTPSRPRSVVGRLAQLPFTGLMLPLIGLLGAALTGIGFGLRKYAQA